MENIDTTNSEILAELKKLNQRLAKLTKLSKVSFSSFITGTFHSLGTIFGTLIIASTLIYVFSQFNFTSSISKWIENTMSQVNWTKITNPQINTTEEKVINTDNQN